MFLRVYKCIAMLILISMLEQLLVDLNYPYTANCSTCTQILFQLPVIDQLVRTKPKSIGHSPSPYTAKFYMLVPEVVPSSLVIDKVTYLSQAQPFFMQFVGDVKCGHCGDKVGVRMLTVSSEFHYPELLDRVLVHAIKVRIRTSKEDVTEQVSARFDQPWDQQSSLDSSLKDQSPKDQPLKSQVPQAKQELPIAITGSSMSQKPSRQSTLLRRQLQQENQQQKQVIKQIISSIDFFNEVLASLERRVTQAEDVCNVLKGKVEAIIPLLRRKD